MEPKIEKNFRVGRLFTFIPNRNLPVYNWFYYKEGFSRELVLLLLKKFGAKEGKVCLDPFCGVGTTLLACKESGIDCIGFDVLPLAVFVSRVKVADYEKERLEEVFKALRKIKYSKVSLENVPKRVRKFFHPGVLEDILLIKEKVEGIEDRKIRDFFTLALINASIKCSFLLRDGAVLKIRERRHIPPLKEMFIRISKKMIRDLERIEFKKCKIRVEQKDARFFNLEEKVDLVITSPPYLNKIEYLKEYEVEHLLFFKGKGLPPLRSSFGLPETYFRDLSKFFECLSKACKEKAKIAIIIGDGVAEKRVVKVPEEVCRIAFEYGFKIRKIVIGRERIATTPGRRRIGKLRECLILGER